VRLLSGEDKPTSGLLKLGHNVIADYFAQDQYKVLDPEARMFDDISRTAPKVPETDLRSLLGCFLFSGNDVFKRLGVLSGGERNRYALARILVSPANFLLLDEPTNHLDLRAKDVLLDAINKFTGTVIFVSHDRYFIDRLATRVFEVADGKVHVYPGNYEDYLWRKEGGSDALAAATAAAIVPEPVPVPVAVVEASTNGSENVKARRVNPIKLKQMQERLFAVEEEMPQVETAIAATEAALGNFVNAEETARLSKVLEGLRDMQSSLTEEWEGLMLELEEG
jgi:ATP-binding cassette subfamily F protein 3